ncbi:ferritin [candidate division GN15 bacterium]|uniref:Ferritin n=1 Tax=candidate division GN15 bacterium TaxID=2072418 RepID=A0A855XCQ4_9BACT|nr:MAG: ferritin [candidate division GN15 bacterium]
MMISKEMAARLNVQVNHEFENERSYLAMAYWFESIGLKVFAKFFFKQAGEERGHGEKIAKYLIDQGAEVVLGSVAPVQVSFKSAKEAAELFVKVEVKTTTMVHEIVEMAVREKDYATHDFINWKVGEQVEEVATANEVLGMVKIAETPGQLLMLEGRIWQMIEKG